MADLEDNHQTMQDRLFFLKDRVSTLLKRMEHVYLVLERSIFVQSHLIAHVAELEKFQEGLKGLEAPSLVLRASLQSLSSLSSV